MSIILLRYSVIYLHKMEYPSCSIMTCSYSIIIYILFNVQVSIFFNHKNWITEHLYIDSWINMYSIFFACLPWT